MQQKVAAVTGANGFIGLHIVQKLLNSNFKVIATVRDANNVEKTKDLKNLNNAQNLEIASADLFQKQDFVEIFKKVNFVVHNASPLIQSDKEEDFVEPALNGVQNVFEAILQQQVGQISNVVFISSMAAVCGAPGSKPVDYVFTENDWSDPVNQRERKVWYSLSKTLAEQKTVSYEDQLQQKGITLSRICPTLVLGPLLQTGQINQSQIYVAKYLNGEAKEIPNYSQSIIDVRDISEMVLQSILKNAGGRFMGVSQGCTIEQMVEIIRKFAGVFAKNVPTQLAGGELAVVTKFNLERAQWLIGREMIGLEETIKASVDSLITNKFVQIEL